MGTVFAFSTGQAPLVATRPAAGMIGQAVVILGYELTGVTTGKVQVVRPSGTLTSNVAFEVAP